MTTEVTTKGYLTATTERDITARNRTDEEIRRLNADLEQRVDAESALREEWLGDESRRALIDELEQHGIHLPLIADLRHPG